MLTGWLLALCASPLRIEAVQPPADPAASLPQVNPAAAQPPADPAAVQPPADPAAVQPPADPAASLPQADPAAAQSPADPGAVPSQPEGETGEPQASEAKDMQEEINLDSILTDELREDIERSLDADALDAIINGYMSLLNTKYILHEELDMELVGIGNGHRLDPLAAQEIWRLVGDARRQGLYINVTSSYRTYAYQVSLFKDKIRRLEAQGMDHEKAVEEAAKEVAAPGTSEHHLGLTVDFVTGSYKKLDSGITKTKEYQWVQEHAWEYGYIIRYPQGKSDITGIISEPWHLRYVGIPAAKLITEQEVCLEEFLGVAYDDQKNGISHGAGWVNTGR